MKKNLITLGILGTIALGGVYLGAPANEISKDKLTEKYNASVEIKAKYQINNATLVKTDIKNAELDLYKGEPKDEVKVTLGDANLQEFTPDIELKRWNEVSFKLKPKGLDEVATKDKNLSFEADKVKFETPKMDFEMFDVADGYKYIWYLNEKPLTNKIEFEIQSEGLDFFYQPPLTEEFKDGYSDFYQREIVVTETNVKDLNGNVFFVRPENVVGSYAVYHSTKGVMNDINGKDYKVGKAFHIYRPHIIDAVGKETWGKLHIENGIYSVEIPQEFLDTAVYPIKSNDTFGTTGVGGNYDSYFSSTQTAWGPHSPASSGSATSISYASTGAGNHHTYGFWIDTGSDTPGNLVGDTSEVTTTLYTDSWTTANLDSSVSVTGSQPYFMGLNSSDGYGYRVDTGISGQHYYYRGVTYSSGSLSNPFGSPSDLAGFRISIYATYTPGGGGTPAKTSPIIWFD